MPCRARLPSVFAGRCLDAWRVPCAEAKEKEKEATQATAVDDEAALLEKVRREMEAEEAAEKEREEAELMEKKRKEEEERRRKEEEAVAKKKKDEELAAAKKKKEEEAAAAKKAREEAAAEAKKKREQEVAEAKRKRAEMAAAAAQKKEEAAAAAPKLRGAGESPSKDDGLAVEAEQDPQVSVISPTSACYLRSVTYSNIRAECLLYFRRRLPWSLCERASSRRSAQAARAPTSHRRSIRISRQNWRPVARAPKPPRCLLQEAARTEGAALHA